MLRRNPFIGIVVYCLSFFLYYYADVIFTVLRLAQLPVILGKKFMLYISAKRRG